MKNKQAQSGYGLLFVTNQTRAVSALIDNFMLTTAMIHFLVLVHDFYCTLWMLLGAKNSKKSPASA